MLSKSQARLFFITGTLVFTGVFLYLTMDSLAKIPAQTHGAQISAAVIRGKHIFDKNNCMGCHTILGEGAYYAPELTKVYARRGPVWIKTFLKDPEAMFPQQRRMVQYHFSDAEINDLTAFFQWIGNMDLNGFPAKPDLKSAITPNPSTTSVATSGPTPPPVFKQICSSCHSLHGQGGHVGPALDGVGKKYDAAWLDRWLQNPAAVKPGTAMPKLPLDDQTRNQVVQFLVAQQ